MLLREVNAGLREEMELLRVEGGRLGDLYWKNKAEELRKELKEMDDQLTEKISRIAFLEREMQEYRRNVNLGTTNTATLYYPTTTEDVASTAVIIDIAQIFDEEVVAVRSQALDFS